MLLRAAADLLRRRPDCAAAGRVAGGPSRQRPGAPDAPVRAADELGITDRVTLPAAAVAATSWRTCTAPPTWSPCRSYSESFGLVAVEAQACGTPVVAAAVGGLPVAVRDGVSGVLVDGHDPTTGPPPIAGCARPARRRRAGRAGRRARRHVLLGAHRRRAAGELRPRDRATHAEARHRRAELLTAQRAGVDPRDAGCARDRPRAARQAIRSSRSCLHDAGIEWEPRRAATASRRRAAGERRLKTNTILLIGEHSVRRRGVRLPQARREPRGRLPVPAASATAALRRRLPLDNVGDIYLVGRMALRVGDADEIDRLLGQVLEAVDATSTRCWSWVSARRSRRSGSGGSRAASR